MRNPISRRQMAQLKEMEINGQRFGSVVEAILFAADRPLSAHDIATVITSTELSPPIEEEDVAAVVNELIAELEEQGRAFTIQVVGGGYTFATQPKYHSWLEYFQHQNAKRKLSPSAVETLAIVAYRQPITKPLVDHIRGVDSGYILRQLLEKDLIEVAGRYEGPGRALLYRTTPVFLQHFGINTIDELPKPREIEEILKDDDMAEHRQLMLELKSELRPPLMETGGVNDPRESTESDQPNPGDSEHDEQDEHDRDSAGHDIKNHSSNSRDIDDPGHDEHDSDDPERDEYDSDDPERDEYDNDDHDRKK